MYIWQVAAALTGALVGGYLGFSLGFSTQGIIAAAALSYLVVRWVLAVIQRTRYWLSRGTRGVYSEYCPNCEQQRHRMAGDWILTCRRCGWKSGKPVLRWLVQSVPAIQFKRSVSRTGAFVAGAAIAALVLSPTRQATAPSPSPSVFPGLPSLPSSGQIVGFGAALLILVAVIIWIMRPRQYYCRNCGQDLGRGDPPEACPKCGSNRFTTDDPGVGKKRRVEQLD